MLHNPLLRKLVQISEEALPPTHVPLILGNDFFILTQQDVRKTEESRFFTISKVLPNGSFKVINPLNATECLQQLSLDADSQCQHILNSLFEFINCKRNANQEYQQVTLQQPQQYSAFNDGTWPQPMEVSMPADTKASISQQLHWNKCTNNNAPLFPVHYSHGTSTTEINGKQVIKDRTSVACIHSETCPQCKNLLTYYDKSTSVQEIPNVCTKKSNGALDAREQLKKKKMNCSFN